MRSEILAGELRPGTKLVERVLAERYGTSRGPVREALRELAREGLVVELPRRGTVVSTLTARDLMEVYAVREALELGAAKEALGRIDAGAVDELGRRLDALEESWEQGDYLDAAEHDLAFHRQLVSLAANSRLAAMYEQMLTTTSLLLRTAAQTSPGLREPMDPEVHRRIVSALEIRKFDQVRAAVEDHYRYAHERLFAAWGDAASSPDD